MLLLRDVRSSVAKMAGLDASSNVAIKIAVYIEPTRKDSVLFYQSVS